LLTVPPGFEGQDIPSSPLGRPIEPPSGETRTAPVPDQPRSSSRLDRAGGAVTPGRPRRPRLKHRVQHLSERPTKPRVKPTGTAEATVTAPADHQTIRCSALPKPAGRPLARRQPRGTPPRAHRPVRAGRLNLPAHYRPRTQGGNAEDPGARPVLDPRAPPSPSSASRSNGGRSKMARKRPRAWSLG